MKSLYFKIFLSIIIALIFSNYMLLAQTQGEDVFNKYCTACHTINKGKLVGPDLVNVNKKRTEEWLLKFIKSSQTLIQSGDIEAVAIFEEYNKTPMPDHNLSDDEIKSVISYIEIQSSSENITTNNKSTISSDSLTKLLSNLSQDEVIKGRNLFQGIVNFANDGGACISCHNVTNNQLMEGGLLAKDLTDVISRLNSDGVYGIITNPPFPVMKSAYINHQITNEEALALTFFLMDSNKNKASQDAQNIRIKFLSASVGGLIILLGIFSSIWYKRRTQSVNHQVFKRQIKSY